MTPPHPLLEPLLFSIESIVISTWKGNPRLQDKDVAWVYEQYKTYFRAVGGGSDVPEPTSTTTYRETLLMDLWEMLLLREELQADGELVENPAFAPAGRPLRQLEEVYIMAFNRLHKSVRFWRKTGGVRGYLNYVKEYVGSEGVEDM